MSITGLELKMVDPSLLKMPQRIVREFGDEQLFEMMESIRRFGFLSPILVFDDLTIVTGFVRHAAAIEMQLSQVPVLVVSGMSSIDAISYQIVDNRLGENSTWQINDVQVHLHDLDDAGKEPRLPGFSDEEFKHIYSSLLPFFGDVPLVRVAASEAEISDAHRQHIQNEIRKLGAPMP